MNYNYKGGKHYGKKTINFIFRLKEKEITNFLEEIYPKNQGYVYSFKFCKHPNSSIVYIYGSCINNRIDYNSSFNLHYYSCALANPNRWYKYLYKLFGNKYKVINI